MKYRTKLYLYFLLVAILSVSIALFVLYYETRKRMYEQMGSKVTSIAATTASQVNGNLLKEVQTQADEKTVAYQTVKKQLQEARVANRRKDVYVRYVYTLRPSEEHQGYLEVVVDASKNPKTFSPVGELHLSKNIGGILENLNRAYSPKVYTHTVFGDFLTGFAPVYDDQGNYVATVGVDIEVENVVKRLNVLLYYGFFSLGISMGLAIFMAYYLAKRPAKFLRKINDAAFEIGAGNLDYQVQIKTNDEFGIVGDCINNMTKGLKERERLKVNFSRYVSQHVLDKIVMQKTEAKTEGVRKRITVLFSDIHEFTLLTEKLEPQEVVLRLNQYFSKMLNIIFKYDGTLDKFIGDGIMVNFGSLVDDPEQEKHGILTALEMQKALQELNDEWRRQGKETLNMGIGVHTGDAIVGNIGSERRLEYTAIGDTVNVAARLEAETKRRKLSILVSHVTYEKVKDQFQFESLGQIELSGREKKIEVFKPI